MCRLFGMTGGDEPVTASFWLLDAPDSLAVQSRHEPDGTGLGLFDASGDAVVHRWPIAAYEDRAFAREARRDTARTFVAHVRYASTGAAELRNTHPFEQHGRILAHNGVVEDLDALEDELGEALGLVQGDTDSERVFALVTKHIEATGDVTTGLVRACEWVADRLPVYALNLVLATPEGLWALRYPDTHDLFVLERRAGGHVGGQHLDLRSSTSVRVRSTQLADRPAVVVASERMDDDPAWRLLRPGELVHVDRDLRVSGGVVLDRPPARLLTLADLSPRAAGSQQGWR